MSLNRLIRVIHRDLGYLCAGGMVIYAVSGLLLNHIHDFNSNYRVVRETYELSAEVVSGALYPGGVRAVLDSVGEARRHGAVFQPDPRSLHIFVGGDVLQVDLDGGRAVYERVGERTVLKGVNDLHLNRAGPFWTWMADIYAAALGLLAVTGLLVLTGRQGIRGRGVWLTGAGILIPAILAVLFL